MSNLREKAIEIAKQTSSESAFMCGYDRACQEYEEKLRWIPVEEKLPDPLNTNKIVVKLSKIDTRYGFNDPYTEIRFASINCHGQFILSLMNNYEAEYITAWRYFL